jgi:SAM-dependent methyltransferase
MDEPLLSELKSISVKSSHEYYLDKWLGLYEYDDYKRWLFSGIVKILKKYVRNGIVLEIGCSRGYLSELVNREGYFCIGGDISITALRSVRNKNQVMRLDGETLPFKNASFDAVLAINSLEHMPQPQKVLKEVFRVLRNDGLFLGITPDKGSLLGKFGSRLVTYTSLKNPYHVGLMNKKEMNTSLDNAGFKSLAVLPFHNGFLGAPLVSKISKREFIMIPINICFLVPFSHHQLVIALKS